MSIFRYISILILSLFLLSSGASAEDNIVPKLVYLIAEDDKLIASNIKFNRFDEIKLEAKETVKEYAVGKAVIVIVTNKRFVAYSVFTASWRARDLIANEELRSIEAEDYSALVVTSKRYLNFNGKNGVWAETPRSKLLR